MPLFQNPENKNRNQMSLNTNPSFADLIAVHEIAVLDVDPDTLQHYRVALLNVVEAVHLHDRGFKRKILRPRKGKRLSAVDYPRVANTPLTVLTAGFCQRVKEAWVKGIDAEKDKARYDSVLSSADSMLDSAKAMFSPAARRAYEAAEIVLPVNIGGFMATHLLVTKKTEPVPPSEEVLHGANRNLDLLERTNPELFVVAGLAYYNALTHTEIVGCCFAWVKKTPDGLHLAVWRGDKARERLVPLHPRLVPYLCRHRSGHVLRGTAYAREQTVRETVKWLKEHGGTKVRRPLEQYREYAVWILRSIHKPGKFSHYAGHARPGTSRKYLRKPRLDQKFVNTWRDARASLPPAETKARKRVQPSRQSEPEQAIPTITASVA